MITDEKLVVIRTYYDGCSAGDVEANVGTLTPEVTHYFLAPNPAAVLFAAPSTWLAIGARSSACSKRGGS